MWSCCYASHFPHKVFCIKFVGTLDSVWQAWLTRKCQLSQYFARCVLSHTFPPPPQWEAGQQNTFGWAQSWSSCDGEGLLKSTHISTFPFQNQIVSQCHFAKGRSCISRPTWNPDDSNHRWSWEHKNICGIHSGLDPAGPRWFPGMWMDAYPDLHNNTIR